MSNAFFLFLLFPPRFPLFFSLSTLFFPPFSHSGDAFPQAKQFSDRNSPMPQREKIQCNSTENAYFNNSTAPITTTIKYKRKNENDLPFYSMKDQKEL